MIYYPLSTLMLAGIREILIITTPRDQDQFRRLLGDGSRTWAAASTYAEQADAARARPGVRPRRRLHRRRRRCLILGDNIFYGYGLGAQLKAADRSGRRRASSPTT